MDNNTALIIAIVAVVAIVGALAWWYSQRRRSEDLQNRFGPEYEHTLAETGDRRRAEAELSERQKRVESFDIRDLTGAERTNFAEEWSGVQARFVDDPRSAIAGADRLVARVMRARGYPVGDFEQRAVDVSVDHPTVVENYRSAHDIALRSDRGDASTEDLRQAMVYYRSLFADLLGDEQEARPEVKNERVA